MTAAASVRKAVGALMLLVPALWFLNELGALKYLAAMIAAVSAISIYILAAGWLINPGIWRAGKDKAP